MEMEMKNENLWIFLPSKNEIKKKFIYTKKMKIC